MIKDIYHNKKIKDVSYGKDNILKVIYNPSSVDFYKIVYMLNNTTIIGEEITTIRKGESVTIHLKANEGYALPTFVKVLNGAYGWSFGEDEGTLTISHPSDTVIVVVNSRHKEKIYNINLQLNGVSLSKEIEYTIGIDDTKTIELKADENYDLPDEIEVENCEYTYMLAEDNKTAKLELYEPSDDVIIKVNGIALIDTYLYDINGELLTDINDLQLMYKDEEEHEETWTFMRHFIPYEIDYNIRFKSYNREFSRLRAFNYVEDYIVYSEMMYDNIKVFDNNDFDNTWLADDFQTITLLERPSEELENWLSLYALKIEYVDVSNKTFKIKDNPTFSNDLSLGNKFETDMGGEFDHIFIYFDGEIYYQSNGQNTIAFRNGLSIIPYNIIQFKENQTMLKSDYEKFIQVFEVIE